MWLLGRLPRLARFAVRTYFRFETAGETVPSRGPLLLVANHPNALIDPAIVLAAAGRPVRFLAKAPLFEMKSLGWLVRAAGSIPVFRRHDDGGQTADNQQMFAAVQEALLGGAAVGVFPEGISHSEPALTPLRTGAARMALSAAAARGENFPIIPIGLNFRKKDTFRSRSLALIGRPLEWHDLPFDPADPAAVRELTRRIDAGLRRVTVTLERWEDAALIDLAERIYATEYELPRDPGKRTARKNEMSSVLARLRIDEPGSVASLADAITHFGETLRALGIPPRALDVTASGAVVARWVARKTTLAAAGLPLLLAGWLIFFIPYHLVGLLGRTVRTSDDVRSTVKVLAGAVIYLLWIAVLAGLIGHFHSPLAALGFALAAPLLGVATIRLTERFLRGFAEARRYLILDRRSTLRERLLRRRKELAEALERLRARTVR
jgi:glycerol-3-phosphate O-acyltransferase / dihydroxyacetone phosphate acyltransferase